MSLYRPFREEGEVSPGRDVSRATIAEKVAIIEEWLIRFKTQKEKKMLYLIAYDIEDNKIRTHIARFLIKKGCLRVQKSVYVAKSDRTTYQEIHQILREINSMYRNHDSIFMLPVPEEKFTNIKLIGKNVEFEVVTKPKNVIFF